MRSFRAWSKKHNRYLKITGIQYDDDKIAGVFVVFGTIAGIPNIIFLELEDVILEGDTGFKDKNGREIYEGDIVDDGFSNICKIGWSEKLAGFKAVNEAYGYATSIWLVSECGGKVIGNIHENQDLLGDTNVTNKEK